MVKRNWLKETKDVGELVASVCAYLEVASLDEKIPLAVSFKCSPEEEPDYAAKVAWVKRVEHLAHARECKPYKREELIRRLPELLSFTENAQDVEKVRAWLADLGIKCIYVPHLTKTYIDGVAFFLGNVPVVALSLRYNRLDCYWFNLCHELNHIIHGKRHSYIDFELNNPEAMAREGDEVEERAANQHARNWLLDHDAYTGFVKLTQPFFSHEKVMAFAGNVHRHPSIDGL